MGRPLFGRTACPHVIQRAEDCKCISDLPAGIVPWAFVREQQIFKVHVDK